MVELIAGIVTVLVLLGILFAVPRYVGSGGPGGTGTQDDSWPDILGGLERGAIWWLSGSRAWDIALGVVAVIILGAAVGIYQDPAILGGLEESMEFVAHTLAALGLVGLFATTYLSIRRAGLRGAEASFVGAILVGTVMLLLVSALLID